MIGLKELAAQRGLPIQITASADEHAKQVVDRVLAALRAAIDARGRASLALSGGRSPKAMLRRLNTVEFDWEQVTLTLVDERWVAPEHADSNAGLLWRHMPAVMNKVNWLPLYRGIGLAEDAAASSALIADLLPLDAVVLGMGADGHTASLFPGAHDIMQMLAPDASAPCMPALSTSGAQRLTLSGAALHSARLQLLAVRGEDKAMTLCAALAGQHPEWPISSFLRAPLEIIYSPDGS